MLTSIPHFDQWLGDWAMEPERFMAGYQSLLGLDLHVHLQTGPERAAAAAKEQSQSVTAGDIAIVGLYGMLMKSVPSGEQGTSTVLARRKIRAAAADPAIAAIMLQIDSPGGTVAGTEALAADVAAAAKKKPVYAYIDDLGASAAYWIASQATKVFANASAIVGSIGTYLVVHDLSGQAAMKGIKVHVVRAGEMKGQGQPGTEISAELLAELQQRVTERNEFFVRGVAAGRGLSLEAARQLADGRTYIAAQAVEKRLIDGVGAFDEAMSQLAAAASKRRKNVDATMTAAVVATGLSQDTSAGNSVAASGQSAPPSQAGTAPAAAAARPATYHELKAAMPGADANFIASQLEANATASQAQAAFMSHLAKQNAELTRQLAQQPLAGATGPMRKPGVSQAVPAAAAPAADQQADDGEPIAAFESAVELLTSKGMSRADAIDSVARRQPALHRNYLIATNGDRSAAVRLLKEKYNV